MASFSFNLLLFFIVVPLAFSTPIPNELVRNLDQHVSHVGRGTWYEPGLGNCGWNNYRDQEVLAISKRLYDRNGGSNCGQWIELINTKNGKIAYGYTVDSCESCTDDDLDMSPALFQRLDALSTGVIRISWRFLPRGQ